MTLARSTSPLRARAGAPAADDYVTFCEGIRRLCGVDLSQYKRGQMERRIRTFAQRQGEPDLLKYLEGLKRDRAAVDEFLDRVTINVSQLWRNPDMWQVLRREVLPELAATGRIKAWSAGSSYGAEAYTLAAVCADAVPKAKTSIQGTDIDARMVARAREGRFTEEDAREAPKKALEQHFDRDGEGWRAKPALRSVVRFDTGDLLRMPFPREAYDLVLCRNTVIYFNEDVRDALHARLAESLRVGGYLVIGSTERVAKPREMSLETARPFVYRKV